MNAVLHHAITAIQPANQLMQSSSNIGSNSEDSPEWGAIQISGKDRLGFLQGQLTQDLDRLRPGAALLAGWASPKGRLLCVSWLIDWEDMVWLVLPAELIDRLVPRLRMFVLRADVQITAPNIVVRALERDQLGALELSDKSLDLGHSNHCLYSDNYAAIIPKNIPDMALVLDTNAHSSGAPWAGMQRWRQRCIESGMPTVWAATSEEFVPQMLNLDLLDGISFKKGCYVGQEIVARTQNLGKIKRRMYRYTAAAGQAEPGQPVYSGANTVGQIVDAVSNGGTSELLAVIRIPNLDDNLTLDQAGEIRLERRPLPYAVPESL
jgi:folate-binding protein YgfZ